MSHSFSVMCEENEKKKNEQNRNFHVSFFRLSEGLWNSGSIFHIREFSSIRVLHILAVFILELPPYLKYRTPFWTCPNSCLRSTTVLLDTASLYIHCYLVCNYAWQQNSCSLWQYYIPNNDFTTNNTLFYIEQIWLATLYTLQCLSNSIGRYKYRYTYVNIKIS